jgi:hypothetical protein
LEGRKDLKITGPRVVAAAVTRVALAEEAGGVMSPCIGVLKFYCELVSLVSPSLSGRSWDYLLAFFSISFSGTVFSLDLVADIFCSRLTIFQP